MKHDRGLKTRLIQKFQISFLMPLSLYSWRTQTCHSQGDYLAAREVLVTIESIGNITVKWSQGAMAEYEERQRSRSSKKLLEPLGATIGYPPVRFLGTAV